VNWIDLNRLARLNDYRFLCVSEEDFTRETRAGQFSIFGASEEKSGGGFPELGLMKKWLKVKALGREMTAVFVWTGEG
jgi:hypothetical protein